MNILNLSNYSIGEIYSNLPNDLECEQLIVFPDFNPSQGALPTGVVIKTFASNWKKFTVSDVGCGIRLVKSTLSKVALNKEKWAQVYYLLRENKGKLGDLGGGNHFLNAVTNKKGELFFLIHTGSRDESTELDNFINLEDNLFEKEYSRIVNWAFENRSGIVKVLEKVFGKTELVFDKCHNSFEKLADSSVIIRKGSIKVLGNDFAVIPSHLTDRSVLVKCNKRVSEVLNSLPHGTGRILSRSDAKEIGRSYDFDFLRQVILIPDEITDSSLLSEGPYAYNDLKNTLEKTSDYFDIVDVFDNIGYIGHV